MEAKLQPKKVWISRHAHDRIRERISRPRLSSHLIRWKVRHGEVVGDRMYVDLWGKQHPTIVAEVSRGRKVVTVMPALDADLLFARLSQRYAKAG